MTDKKGWGSTVLGWFVVQDEGQQSPSAPSAEADAANAPYRPFARTAPASTPAPAVDHATIQAAAPGGTVDFDKVFDGGGVNEEERQRVTRTLDLLNSLPPGTDDAVKKQIVMASLKAFGVPVEKIIEAAAAELEALEGFIQAGAKDTETLSNEADQRIKQYEQEIVKLRTVMQQRVEEQAAAVRSCNSKKLEVQKVLEFFGQEAVAKVVRDSPKLHEPTKA